MSRIITPPSIDAAPAAAKPLPEAAHKQVGFAPNLFRVAANSPAALAGFLGMSRALARGRLPAPTRGRARWALAYAPGSHRRSRERLLRRLGGLGL
jgi:hypothetical protein